MEKTIVTYINSNFDLVVPDASSEEQLIQVLAEKINYLIANDFTKLVQILYRIDVSEQKLKYLLKQQEGTDAGKIIALLVIERQLEKIRSREAFKKKEDKIDENEKW